jgi:hypothetical protein
VCAARGIELSRTDRLQPIAPTAEARRLLLHGDIEAVGQMTGWRPTWRRPSARRVNVFWQCGVYRAIETTYPFDKIRKGAREFEILVDGAGGHRGFSWPAADVQWLEFHSGPANLITGGSCENFVRASLDDGSIGRLQKMEAAMAYQPTLIPGNLIGAGSPGAPGDTGATPGGPGGLGGASPAWATGTVRAIGGTLVPSLAAVRGVLSQLRQRVGTDANFRNQLLQNPRRVLGDAGIPRDLQNEILREAGIENAADCSGTCVSSGSCCCETV